MIEPAGDEMPADPEVSDSPAGVIETPAGIEQLEPLPRPAFMRGVAAGYRPGPTSDGRLFPPTTKESTDP